LIRGYDSRDREGVIRLFREFMEELTPPRLASEFRAYIEAAIREELGRIEDYYLSRPRQGFWIAEEEERVVAGMVGLERHSDDTAELRRMAVAAAHRRRGIGRRLLRTAETFARAQAYATMVLSTSELQVPAMRLYESSGYRRTRSEVATEASHKTPGAGLARHWYEKRL
jgi:ribosomal protein S18 acetylase RimI-like enzyme